MGLQDRSCPSLYRGIVEANEDPENLGRCKVRVPSIHGSLTYPIDILPWARPLVLTPVGAGRGSVNIPDVGDIVWVMFEGSERDFPIYLGGTYSKGDLTVDKDTIDFYIDENARISYNRGGSYTMIVGSTKLSLDGNTVIIEGNTIIKGDLSVQGSIHAYEDVLAGAISLQSHTHEGVYPGGSSTSTPR